MSSEKNRSHVKASGAIPVGRSRSRRHVGLAAASLVLLIATAVVVGFTRPGERDPEALVEVMGLNQVRLEPTNDGDWRPVCWCSLPVQTEDLPNHLVLALVAREDPLFFHHHGLDLWSILRALAQAAGGSDGGGASTITQQLVKFTLLSRRQTADRKATELALALQVEASLSKTEIIVLYFNRAYFGTFGGSPVVGIEAAARTYFGKHARELNLTESSLLVAMLAGPDAYNVARFPDRARARARRVLAAMVDEGFITLEQADRAGKAAIRRGAVAPVQIAWQYFADWVLEDLKRRHPGIRLSSSLRIFVTLDTRTQQWAEHSLARLAGQLARSPAPEGALVSMTRDGAVMAMAGGSDYARSQFNRATAARRQPGSVFKLFVYLAALEAGLTPQSLIEDAPLGEAAWGRNPGGRYFGLVPLRFAFSRSLNSAALRLAARVGRGKVIEVARRLGIVSALSADETLALGTSEATLMEMTAAYGAVATGGLAVAPYGIALIADDAGNVLHRHEASDRRVLEAGAAARMTEMLRAVVAEGTGAAANFARDAAGKTGTSDEGRDAWFVGFTETLVTGIWSGSDIPMPIPGNSGARVAAAWANFNANVTPR